MFANSQVLSRPQIGFLKIALLTLSFSVLTALSSKFLIPLGFSPVPITLQSLVIALAGMYLGSKAGASSQVALILMGLAGLPVFTSPLPGQLVLMGPTGGYILGFILCAFVTGWIFEREKNAGFIRQVFYVFLGSLFIFLPGVVWLSQFTGQNLLTAIQVGFLPFLVGDILKCVAAVSIYRGFKKL